jgi:hypothetical protein
MWQPCRAPRSNSGCNILRKKKKKNTKN